MFDTFFDDLYEDLEELVADTPEELGLPEFCTFTKDTFPDEWSDYNRTEKRIFLKDHFYNLYGHTPTKFYFNEDKDTVSVDIYSWKLTNWEED